MANLNEVDYPSEATIGDQWARDLEQPLMRPLLSPADLRRRITQVAYELYLRRGKRHGYDVEDWLTAESLVLSELTASAKPAGERAHGEEAH